MGPFEEALASLREFILQLKTEGVALQYLDFGGGLGISYNAEEPPSPAVYGAAVTKATKDLGLTIVLEPGRVIAGSFSPDSHARARQVMQPVDTAAGLAHSKRETGLPPERRPCLLARN